MSRPAIELARALGRDAAARFVAGETDAVYLIYRRFRSAISQSPTVDRLLPLPDAERDGSRGAARVHL